MEKRSITIIGIGVAVHIILIQVCIGLHYVKTKTFREVNNTANKEETFYQGELDQFCLYWIPILAAVITGWVAWMLYLGSYNIPSGRYRTSKKLIDFIQIFLFIPAYLNVVCILYAQGMPFTFYCFFLFPIFMIHLLLVRYNHIIELSRYISSFGYDKSILILLTYIWLLRLFVQGLYDRAVYSAIMLLLSVSPNFFTSLTNVTSRYQKVSWAGSCFLLAAFPYLPVMEANFNIYLYLSGYVIWWFYMDNKVKAVAPTTIVSFQHKLFKFTVIYTMIVELGLIDLDSPFRYFGCIWALYSVAVILCSTPYIFTRLTSIFVGFATIYSLMTANCEMIFLAAYVFALYTWTTMEGNSISYLLIQSMLFNRSVEIDRVIQRDDYRRAFFFVTFVFVGFFGIGDLEILQSLRPLWIGFFMPAITPGLTMAFLVLLKIMIPFIFALCVYRFINVFRLGNMTHMFCIVILFFDAMLFDILFYLIIAETVHGIDTSMIHFMTMNFVILCMLMLYPVCILLTAFIYPEYVTYYITLNMYEAQPY